MKKFNYKEAIFTFITIVAGLASILGLVINIIYTYDAIKNNSIVEYKSVILTLGFTTSLLLLSVIFLILFYTRSLNKLGNLPVEYENTRRKLLDTEILLKNSADYFHNIFHYYRNLLEKITQANLELDSLNEAKLKNIFHEFDSFMKTLTSNLQSYFTLLTNDSCSVCIKIVKGKKVKTFYRDPINYRSRKKSDKKLDGNDFVYNHNENTAFQVICSEDYKDATFLCDDLRKLKKENKYKNKNEDWETFYNATAVVPINIKHHNGKRNIIGFVCLDNYKGGLNTSSVENYLCAISDPLYNLFIQYAKIAETAIQKGVTDERIESFTNWDTN